MFKNSVAFELNEPRSHTKTWLLIKKHKCLISNSWKPTAICFLRYNTKACKECLTRPQGERLKLQLLSCTAQRKAHSVPSSPAVGDCFGPFTLLLTRPHCSRDVSTLFLSENILRMLKDSAFGETQNQQQADTLENELNIRRKVEERQRTGRERRSGWGGRGLYRSWKQVVVAVSHFFTGIFPSWFTCSFNFVYLQQARKKGKYVKTVILNLVTSTKHRHDSLRFEEEGVPRCILGEYVCGQSEQLIRPNLETHTRARAGMRW